MRVTLTSVNIVSSPDQWDAFVAEHNGHLLQSWAWGAFKERHGWQAQRLLAETSNGAAAAQVLYRFKGPVSVGYIPRGPVIASDANAVWPELLKEIDHAARQNRTIMTVIEPDRELGLTGTYHQAGLVGSHGHIQPGRTVKIPLLDDDAILKQMHQKTRYHVRRAGRRGVTIERAETNDANIDAYYALMTDTSERNAFSIHSREYYADFLRTFGDKAQLFFARVESGELAAALIAVAFGQESIYMYGGSSTAARADGAAFLLQFEAMRWSREHGCAWYDLWGLPEEDPDTIVADDNTTIAATSGDDWRGLYRFKTGFGGEIVKHPPMVERRHIPILPWVARKLNLMPN